MSHSCRICLQLKFVKMALFKIQMLAQRFMLNAYLEKKKEKEYQTALVTWPEL